MIVPPCLRQDARDLISRSKAKMGSNRQRLQAKTEASSTAPPDRQAASLPFDIDEGNGQLWTDMHQAAMSFGEGRVDAHPWRSWRTATPQPTGQEAGGDPGGAELVPARADRVRGRGSLVKRGTACFSGMRGGYEPAAAGWGGR